LFITYTGTGNAVPTSPTQCVVVCSSEETATFDVSFLPKMSQRSAAEITFSVEHNCYEKTVVQLIGEGFMETITLDDVCCIDDSAALGLDDENYDHLPGKKMMLMICCYFLHMCCVYFTSSKQMGLHVLR
jgi:hypothetical protein